MIYILLLILFCLNLSSAKADQSQSDAVGETGSITLTRIYTKALELSKLGQKSAAILQFKKAIAVNPDFVDFYIGLLNASIDQKNWSDVSYAVQNIFRLDPAYKPDYTIDYGEALYHLGKYDEAEANLKTALTYIDKNITSEKLHKEAQSKKDKEQEVITKKLETTTPPPSSSSPSQAYPSSPQANSSVTNLDKSAPVNSENQAQETPKDIYHPAKRPDQDAKKIVEQYRQSYEAALKSESILLAQYEGYDKSDDIRYNHPPKAYYHIKKVLKGPPLNASLPIRYDFHLPKDTQAPPNWKFSSDIMPKPGSLWIIFIENALTKHGMYETFEGSYGRQEANDENLNKIYDLIDKSSGQ